MLTSKNLGNAKTPAVDLDSTLVEMPAMIVEPVCGSRMVVVVVGVEDRPEMA